MALWAVGNALLAMSAFRGHVCKVVRLGAEEEMVFGVDGVAAGRVVAVVQDVEAIGNRAVC